MDKKSKKIIQQTIRAIKQIKLSNAGYRLTELNQLIYAAAAVINDELGHKSKDYKQEKKNKPLGS